MNTSHRRIVRTTFYLQRLPATLMILVFISLGRAPLTAADDVARYHSNSDARYLHHIDLYDVENRKVTPESTRPYSPKNTCGRCHDYQTISHGWHFNAFDSDSVAGRPIEPWIWTDARTATQLPLSYREGTTSFDPREVGISSWAMTHKFGGRVPGGSMGQDVSDQGRWPISGALEIDCLACHAVSGQYDINRRREQIELENFAWAPTAAIRIGEVDGAASRIKEGSDLADESSQSKIPQVTYDPRRFGLDGTVFVDLIRAPSNNACYQCHSQRVVEENGISERWGHDEDVHIQAGMQCVDCHRNGIDHNIVRGFTGQEHPDSPLIRTLTCQGCHLGDRELMDRSGRLGSPKPLHPGLPPVHFEKLTCTACHSGPVPRGEALRMMTSLAHGLGEKGHRTGDELPALVSGVFTPGSDGRVAPHKAMWPAFWGWMSDEKTIKAIAPEQVYQWTRRTLRVRKSFVEEILRPKDSGEVDDQAFQAKVAASLRAIEKEQPGQTAVYVSSSRVYAAGNEDDKLREIESADPTATEMITWPLAHNVRPAGWSLGTTGCTECHADDGLIFASTVGAIGPVPGNAEAISMASLQGIDPVQRDAWNQLFIERTTFKYVIAGSIAITFFVVLLGSGMLASKIFSSGRGTTRVQR